ncbi:MAG TPA: hypothetical protein VJW51_03960 [Candidatus Acidoferrales bacterium]|nr:hypothetical protein [Candidatus Acidoferrales bacterium]
MRNPIAGYLGIALLAGLALASVSRAQSQTTPPPQPPAQQNPDSLADAAAKAKEAKSGTAPKKVYTNDDLGGGRRGDVSVVGNTRADGKAGKSTTANNEPKNEQYWRGRAQKLRSQMAEVDRQIAQLTPANQTNGNGTSGSTSSSPAPLSAYSNASHARAGVPLERLQNRKAELQAQMDQLEEEARKAGVPPGWLR